MSSNPFTLTFGQKPLEYIPRNDQISIITDTFDQEYPTSHTFMLAGIRGSGKTVSLAEISAYFEQKKDWTVLRLSSNVDILEGAVAELTRKSWFKTHGVDINLSVLNNGISIHSIQMQNDAIIRNACEDAQKKKERILFVIDEIVKNNHVKVFSSAFQIYLSMGYPVYLVMAGLYDNINNLQNDSTLTFLYRTPKIFLEPLSIPAMAMRYQKVFEIDRNEALQMAQLTNGYPFAFQILGHLRWTNGSDMNVILDKFDNLLADYVYTKVWKELSNKDQEVVYIICQGIQKTSEIKDRLGMSPQLMNEYRKRLIDRGVVNGEERGVLKLALPRFEVYVNEYCEVPKNLRTTE